MEELYETINKLDSVLPPNKKLRKKRTTKPKQPAITPTPTPTPTTTTKTTPKTTLKNSTDSFKIQKNKETKDIIKQHAILTKQIQTINKSITKLTKQK